MIVDMLMSLQETTMILLTMKETMGTKVTVIVTVIYLVAEVVETLSAEGLIPVRPDMGEDDEGRRQNQAMETAQVRIQSLATPILQVSSVRMKEGKQRYLMDR